MAAELKIISSMATREVLAALAIQYREAAAVDVVAEAVGGVEAARRVQAGEAVDVVVLAAGAIDQLIAAGKLVAGSRVDLVRSGIAVAVRAGATRPDIGSEDAVKHAVLAAKTVGYSTGPSGVYLEQLFARWGIAKQVRPRLVQAPTGVPVGRLIAEGKVELGFQQLSELMHLEGIAILGPLPPAIQLVTTFSAGVSSTSTQTQAARALLGFMTSPVADAAKRGNGMEPA